MTVGLGSRSQSAVKDVFFLFFPCFSIMQIPILFSLLTCLESEDEAELSSRVLG